MENVFIQQILSLEMFFAILRFAIIIKITFKLDFGLDMFQFNLMIENCLQGVVGLKETYQV